MNEIYKITRKINKIIDTLEELEREDDRILKYLQMKMNDINYCVELFYKIVMLEKEVTLLIYDTLGTNELEINGTTLLSDDIEKFSVIRIVNQDKKSNETDIKITLCNNPFNFGGE